MTLSTDNKIHLLDLDKFLELYRRYNNHEIWTKSEVLRVISEWYNVGGVCVSDYRLNEIKKLFTPETYEELTSNELEKKH